MREQRSSISIRQRNHPLRANLRQIHLVQSELLDELREIGFEIDGGALGENISTRDIDLVSLPRATRLQIGRQARVEITGLRAPCIKIERHMRGLRIAASGKRQGKSYLKRSVMGVVVASGWVRTGDQIRVSLPRPPHGSLGLV
jgi:MOSC domain-containing protein YiiM